MNIEEVRAAYDRVAQTYADRLGDELDHKPFDRQWLNDFVSDSDPGGILEAGTGDGHVLNFVSPETEATGLDLSTQMVEVASARYPHLSFVSASMFAMPFEKGAFTHLISFYSIVNLTSEDCNVAFREFRRVLAPGGCATLAFHEGDDVLREGNWWETGAALDFYFHPLERVVGQLEGAGFKVSRTHVRDPYAPTVEAQTRRAYVVAEIS